MEAIVFYTRYAADDTFAGSDMTRRTIDPKVDLVDALRDIENDLSVLHWQTVSITGCTILPS